MYASNSQPRVNEKQSCGGLSPKIPTQSLDKAKGKKKPGIEKNNSFLAH